MKRLSIVTLLTLIASVLVGVMGMRPASANLGESETEVTTTPSDSVPYGNMLHLHGVVRDISDSCGNGDCDLPRGEVHFWYADPNRPFNDTKQFLGKDRLNVINATFDDRTAGDIDYCCLPMGTWLIRAFYVPPDVVFGPGNYDGEFDASADDTTITVRKAESSVSITQSSASSTVGQPVTFTVQVTPKSANYPVNDPRPTGTVRLSEVRTTGVTDHGTKTLDSTGTATFTISDIAVGSGQFSGIYGTGDSRFDPNASVQITHTVTRALSSSSLALSRTSIAYGDLVTFNDTVSPSDATGTVTFLNTDPTVPVQLGTGTLPGTSINRASMSTSSLNAGFYIIAGDYPGDAKYEGSVSNGVGLTVNRADTTTRLSASPTATVYGQSVTFTAAVTGPGTLGGSVQFKDGTTNLGSPMGLSSGSASLTTSALPAATHDISAEYLPDANHNGSTSQLSFVVSRADTTTSLGSASSTSRLGDPVTFTATVSVVSPGGGTPDGTVQFKDGTLNVGSPRTLVNGVASLTLPRLAGGVHSITAEYSGAPNYNPSTSPVRTHTVTCDRMITGTVASVIAPAGTTCLSGATVTGSVTAAAGATVSVVNTKIGTIFKAKDTPAAIWVCGSTIGDIEIARATGFLILGDIAEEGCAANTVKGSVELFANTAGLVLANNVVGSGVKVNSNLGAGPQSDHPAPEVEGNRISSVLECVGNSPAVVNDGSPNQVGGARKGECLSPRF